MAFELAFDLGDQPVEIRLVERAGDAEGRDMVGGGKDIEHGGLLASAGNNAASRRKVLGEP
jgi:hypothetical protein